MDVCCPQCQTVYEVEELNAYSAAISLQCSQCSFVFRFSAPGRSIEENQRRWMIRSSAQGDILYFNTFDVLHRWIMDGSVSGEDSISRTGKRWMALRNIGEFAPIFQTVESIAKIADTRPGKPESVTKTGPKPVASGLDEEIVTKVIPSSQVLPQSQLQPPPRVQGGQGESIKNHTLPYGVAAAARQSTTGEFRSLTPASTTHTPRPTVSSAPQQSQSAQHRAVPRAAAAVDYVDYPAAPVQKEDAWSFGDSLPETELSQRANSEQTRTWGFYDVHAARRRSRRRRTIIAVVAVCVISGLGAAAYFGQEPLQQWWSSAFASRDVIKLGDLAAAEELQEQEQKSDELSVDSVLSGVAVKASHDTSSQQIFAALSSADEKQKQHHQEAQTQAARATKKQNKAEVPDEPAVKGNDLQSILENARRMLESGKPAQARQLYHQAARLDPQNAEAIAGLGWSLLALGNADSARAQFRRAKYRDPSFDGSYIGLGRAERDLGNLDEALKAYEDYLNRFPDGPQVSIARYQSDELKRQLGQ